MIHEIKLPPQTEAYLGGVVHILMNLLAFATTDAFVPFPEEEDTQDNDNLQQTDQPPKTTRKKKKKRKIDEDLLNARKKSWEDYFKQQANIPQIIDGKGKEIADWFWEPGTTA